MTFTVGRTTQGFDVMDPMFLFVGRLAVQKGPDLLLEAPIQEGDVGCSQVPVLLDTPPKNNGMQLICLVCLVDSVYFFTLNV